MVSHWALLADQTKNEFHTLLKTAVTELLYLKFIDEYTNLTQLSVYWTLIDI
jgi:hypothetical protein